MKLHAFLLASLAVTPAVVAQSPSVTVPNHNASLSGNDSALTPFGYDAFRCQQVYAGSSIATSAAWIRSIAFRQDYGPSSAVTIPNVTIRMSHTTRSPGTMSTSFAANETETPVTVFSGSVQLPAETEPAFGPMPFSVSIQLQTPFVYTPGLGNLLVEIVAANPTPAQRTLHSMDASRPGGSIERFGQDGPGVTNLNFDAYGTNGSLRTAAVPGGSIDVTTSVASWSPSYAGAHLIALSTQTSPIALGRFGAAGNWIYVNDVVAGLPLSWQSTFISNIAVSTLSVPPVSSIVGAELYAQCALVEPAANALGLVTTRALRLAIGDSNDRPCQLLTSQDPAASTGAFAFGANDFGGLVTQFAGQIQ